MYKLRRRLQLSQVFLRSRILVAELVRGSSIGNQDLVLEVGPGEGIITSELLQVASRVIATEIDARFYYLLKRRFAQIRNLTLWHTDVLNVKLPHCPYKVFSNIPFSIEGKLVRKFVNSNNPPADCYLVMRRSVAERLGGIYQEGMFSVIHKPWFEFEIFHRFQSRDFSPTPLVNPVMLRITKRQSPLLPLRQRALYVTFVHRAFGGGRRLQQNLRPLFSSPRLNQLAQQYHFSIHDRPRDLSFELWLHLFLEYQKLVHQI